MADTQAQNIATPPAIAPAQATELPNVFSMSKDGRRQAIVLLLGVASIFVFALWSLITTLEGGITGIEWISGLLLFAILLVSPLVAWTLLEEANARISADDTGLTYRTIGNINLKYPWSDITGFKQRDKRGRLARFFLGNDDEPKEARPNQPQPPNTDANPTSTEDDPETVLLSLRQNPAAQIPNPLIRFLHNQAQGDALPIYGNLENRKALLEIISEHILTELPATDDQ